MSLCGDGNEGKVLKDWFWPNVDAENKAPAIVVTRSVRSFLEACKLPLLLWKTRSSVLLDAIAGKGFTLGTLFVMCSRSRRRGFVLRGTLYAAAGSRSPTAVSAPASDLSRFGSPPLAFRSQHSNRDGGVSTFYVHLVELVLSFQARSLSPQSRPKSLLSDKLVSTSTQ
jgi:hypothetical protein